MDEENKKIDIGAFFDRIEEVDGVANNALRQVNINANAIQANKTLINSISVSIEAMKTEIRDIANYIVIDNKIENDEEEDRKFEEEDLRQKEEMRQKAAAMGQQGPKGEPGKPAEQGGGNFLGSLLKMLFTGGAAILAIKYLGPLLLPLVTKTLIPMVGGLASKAVAGTLGFIGANIGKILMGIGATSILGFSLSPIFKPARDSAVKAFDDAGKFFGEKVKGLFTPNAGKNTDSNMSIGGGAGGGMGGFAGDLGLDKIKDKEETEVEVDDDKKEDVSKLDPEVDTSNTSTVLEIGDFDDGKKPRGFMRNLKGLGDALTFNAFDFDKRGKNGEKSQIDTVTIAPANKPNTSEVILRTTAPAIPYIRVVKNQYLSKNPTANALPPEIARLIK